MNRAVLALESTCRIPLHHERVVRHKENGAARLCNGMKQLENLVGTFVIEISRWLVRQNNFRIVQERTGNCHTLLLATRKLVRHVIFFVGKPHLGKHLGDSGLNL